MEPITFPHLAARPPEERVAEAAIALLKHYRRVPTQDEVVTALKIPGQPSTSKATVNRYWPVFQQRLVNSVSLEQWLPSEAPEVLTTAVSDLMQWAVGQAGEVLSERERGLNQRETAVNDEREALKRTELSLLSTIDSLKEDKKQLQTKTAESDREIKSKEAEITNLRLNQVGLVEQVSSLEREKSRLEEENARLRASESHERDQALALRSENHILELKLRDTATALESARASNAAMRSEASASASKLKEALSHADQLRQADALKETQRVAALNDLSQARIALDFANQQIETAKHTELKLTQMIDRAHEKETQLLSSFKSESEKAQSFQHKISELSAEIEKLRTQIDSTRRSSPTTK